MHKRVRIIVFLILFVPLFAEVGTIAANFPTDTLQQKTQVYETEKVIQYFRSLVVEKDQVIRGPIKIIKGDLTVYGKIYGDVVVYFGDVFLEDSSLVDGNVKAISGKIYVSPLSEVSGELIETGMGYYRTRKPRETKKIKVRVEFQKKPYEDQQWMQFPYPFPWQTDDGTVFGYTRVDGFLFGISKSPDYSEDTNVEFYGSLAYSFGRKRGVYQIGLEKVLISPDTNRITLGAEYHSLTETVDDWRMSRDFNSISTLIMKHDYFHYFEKAGYSAYLSFNPIPFFIKFSYVNDRLSPVVEKRRWSLFNQTGDYFDKLITVPFKSWLRGIEGEIRFHKKWSHKDKKTGITVHSSARFLITSSGFSSDYSFNRLLWQSGVRMVNPGKDVLTFRLTIGSTENEYPEFMYFRMGGPGTIRGIRVNSLSGNRMVLIQSEWALPFSWFGDLGLDDEKLALFLDSGLAWSVSGMKKLTEGFDVLKWNNLRTGGGFGIILDSEDDFRIDFGFDFNHSSPKPVTYVTVSKNL